MKKTLLAFSFLFLAATYNPKNAKAQKTDSIITHQQLGEIAKGITPAVQIAYYDGNKISNYNYGFKDIDTKAPIDSETIFQAASLSKIVATYAFLILVDKGLLDLDKPLWQYYEYDRLRNDPNKELLTARLVLTHQTGLPNWTKPRESELKTSFKPGTNYLYSGEAYQYLQLVAEKVTGKTLDEICTDYIFKPFGMTKSHYVYRTEMGKNISIGHKDETTSNKKVQKYTKGNAAYTLCTTADEYMKFVIEGVLNGKGMSEKMHKDFLSPKIIPVAKGKETEKHKHIRCCFGIRIQENEAGTSYWHTGSNAGGFQCVFLVYPKTKKAITVFTNSMKGGNVKLPIFNQFFGEKQTYWLTHK